MSVQVCPKCSGQGHVLKPPYVPGDQPSWVATNTATYVCRICLGSGLAPAEPGESEQ